MHDFAVTEYEQQTEADVKTDKRQTNRGKHRQAVWCVALRLQTLNGVRLINTCLEGEESSNGWEI